MTDFLSTFIPNYHVMNKSVLKLRSRYDKACNEYAMLFCKKQDMDFEGWVADDIGGILQANDYFFNLSDVMYDINTSQPKNLIIQWYDHCVEHPKKKCSYYSFANKQVVEKK